jgi:Putative auto-transporter adhesin, head GIN domain
MICLWLLAAATPILVSAQEKMVSDANAQIRAVGSFTTIRVSDAIDLYLAQGNEETVAASASETKYRDKIRTEVENGVLKIYYEKENGLKIQMGNDKKNLRVYVTCKQLDRLFASGASDVYLSGGLKVDKLELNLSGASDMLVKSGEIKANNLDIKISGASDFKGAVAALSLSVDQSGSSDMIISGSAASMRVTASGASDMKGYELAVDNCEATASGSSDIFITVNKDLKARASGSSDISYKGTAVISELKSSGSSSVSKKS